MLVGEGDGDTVGDAKGDGDGVGVWAKKLPRKQITIRTATATGGIDFG